MFHSSWEQLAGADIGVGGEQETRPDAVHVGAGKGWKAVLAVRVHSGAHSLDLERFVAIARHFQEHGEDRWLGASTGIRSGSEWRRVLCPVVQQELRVLH